MNRKKVFLLLIFFVFMMSLFSGAVFAAEPDEFRLSDIFETIQGFDVAEAYANYSFLIDTLIYFLFFISIAQVTLGKHFEGRGGKGVIIAVGLALAVAISFWAKQNDFTLGTLGPLAALIFAIVIGIWIYRLLRGEQGVGAGLWISIIVIYIAMYMFFPDIINAFQGNKYGRFALAILSILFIIALPMSIISIFKGQGGGGEPREWGGLAPRGGGEGGRWRWPWTHPRAPSTTLGEPTPAEGGEKAVDVKEIKVEHEMLNILKRITDQLDQIPQPSPQSTNTRWKNALKGVESLENEINKLRKDIHTEVRLEQLDERQKKQMGIKPNNKMEKLIKMEVNYLEYLKGVVKNLRDFIEGKMLKEAKSCAQEARNVVVFLLRLNSSEIGGIRS